MSICKLLRRRGSRSSPSFITMSSTSVLASWSPPTISNSGTTLDWTVSGGVVIAKTTINDPTFDFSGNSGTANILVENANGLNTIGIYSLGLTALDISTNTTLDVLQCYDNSIASLDVSANTALTTLSCAINLLASLDVSTNTALTNLFCHANFLETLNISANTELETLYCYDNSLTDLDISINTALITLKCYNNSIASLDVSTNTLISFLDCSGNNQSASVTDQIFIDLDNNSVSNGILIIRNNRTSASDTARSNLITKGWSIYDTYTS